MIQWIIRRTVADYENTEDAKVREGYGVLAGVLGILCNTLLFLIKGFIGITMNSIAILSDGVNNLSDMGSSLVGLIGAKLSNRRPDREHPYGHGRMEYIAALVVAMIILLVGVELLKSSVDKIINPEPVSFSLVMVIILALSVSVKIWMFSYNKYIGGKINSAIQKATAQDSLNDVWATSSVIVTTILGKIFPAIPLDGIVGVAVSALVLKTGISIAKGMVDQLMGMAPDPELVDKICCMITDKEGIEGCHDLVVHDYGPGRIMASVHAEVADDVDIVHIHEVIDTIEQEVNLKLGVVLVVHMDPISLNCERSNRLKQMVCGVVETVCEDMSIHDFRMTDGQERINLIFDMAIPIDKPQKERDRLVEQVTKTLTLIDPKYHAVIKVDDAFTGHK